MEFAESYGITSLWHDVVEKIGSCHLPDDMCFTASEVTPDIILDRCSYVLGLIDKFWSFRRQFNVEDLRYKFLTRQELTLNTSTIDENESNFLYFIIMGTATLAESYIRRIDVKQKIQCLSIILKPIGCSFTCSLILIAHVINKDGTFM